MIEKLIERGVQRVRVEDRNSIKTRWWVRERERELEKRINGCIKEVRERHVNTKIHR